MINGPTSKGAQIRSGMVMGENEGARACEADMQA